MTFPSSPVQNFRPLLLQVLVTVTRLMHNFHFFCNTCFKLEGKNGLEPSIFAAILTIYPPATSCAKHSNLGYYCCIKGNPMAPNASTTTAFAPAVHPLPQRIRLIGRHIRVDAVLARRRHIPAANNGANALPSQTRNPP